MKKVSFAAIFVALSVVFSFMAVNLSESFQIGITELPLMGSGFILGPVFGSLVGLVKDIFTMLTKGYPISLFTFSPILLGLIPGLFTLIIGKKRVYNSFPLLLCIVYVATLARTANNSFALHYIMGLEWEAIFVTLPVKLALVVVEGIIYALAFRVILPIVNREFLND